MICYRFIATHLNQKKFAYTDIVLCYTCCILGSIRCIHRSIRLDSLTSLEGGWNVVGIVFLLLCTLMWSFVGVLVKSASFMIDSWWISFFRFSIGVLFLAIFVKIIEGRIHLSWRNKWIWIGAAGKSINYIFENLGVSAGYAFGNIVLFPMQTLFLLFLTIFALKQEKATVFTAVSVVLCMLGVILVGWNGVPLDQLLSLNGWIMLIFFISAVGSTFHVFSQKMLLNSMSSANMNFSMFFVASFMTAAPLPFYGQATGDFQWNPVLSLVLLGLITAFSFYLYAQAIRRISFMVAAILANSSVLFSLLWSWLFYREPISWVTIVGAFLIFVGIVAANWPSTKRATVARTRRGQNVEKLHRKRNSIP